MEQLAQQLDLGDDECYNFSTFFKPIKVIGQGAFGKVIQATDNSTNEELAIKVIHKKKMGDDFIEKVKQEAIILEKLNHPNVVKFKTVCETETKILIAMELVKGGSLAQLMKDKKTSKQWFKEKDISKIMKSIMLGLAYIHGKNIVHRDLKPENILIGDIDDLSTVKIADFGLSSAFSLWTTNGLTELCGTLLYMAPEFFASRVYSKQIDIWSCGITMHNLLDSGNHPFYDPKTDDQDSFKSKLSNPKWKIPSHFSNLAKNLLQKLSLINPTERYSAIQVLQHPFITENQHGAIPMTMNEQLLCFKQKENFISKIKAMVFLQYVKNLQNVQISDNETAEEQPNKLEVDTNSTQQDFTMSKQSSSDSNSQEMNVKLPTSFEQIKTEEGLSSRGKRYHHHTHTHGNSHLLHHVINCSNSIISNQTESSTTTNCTNNTNNNNNSSYNGEYLITQNVLVKKPPLSFMIKKQKSLNPDLQQLPTSINNLQKKRNSVLNPRQDFTEGSILIEIKETPLDQQGSFSEKTFKRQSIINQISQQNGQNNQPHLQQVAQNLNLYPIQTAQKNANNNNNNSSNNAIITQNSPAKPLMGLNLNRPSTNTMNINHQKRKVNIHPFPPQPLPLTQGVQNNKKESPLKYLDTANTPYSRDSEYTFAGNPQNLLKQMRIKSATRLKQDLTSTATTTAGNKRRNSNLNQISHLHIVKKVLENQDIPANLCGNTTIQYQKENRKCVSSLQTQNNSAKKPPLKQYITQECSDFTKQYLQNHQPQFQKNRSVQNSNQVFLRNTLNKNQQQQRK